MTISLQPTISFRTIFAPVRLFELTEPFSGIIDGVDFKVPKGFLTDFASVPRLFEGVIPNDDPQILRPAVLHDWFYQSQGIPEGTPWWISREDADNILREAMAVCGASWCKRWAVWSAVRIGGGAAWRNALARTLFLRYELTMYRG